VEIVAAGGASEAMAALRDRRPQCVVIAAGLSDPDMVELLRGMQQGAGRDVPVILDEHERPRAPDPARDALAERLPVVRVESRDRLVEELALHLHRADAELPEAQRRALDELRRRDPQLSGRRVLIVDDDVRNIFAVASVLEAHEVEVLHAENGRDGLAILAAEPGIDAVLMDIMMPEMDGYEVIREIRKRDEYQDLPVIAVTAKAMRSDREKCLQAGASDYLAKPVDPDKLLALLRVRTGR
jgi:CheY-like chemotaxis protein